MRFGKVAVPALTQALPSRGAVDALGQIGPDASLAVPALIQIVGKNSPSEVRVAAARALGRIGPAAKESVPTLTEVLKTQNPRPLGSDDGMLRLDHFSRALPRSPARELP